MNERLEAGSPKMRADVKRPSSLACLSPRDGRSLGRQPGLGLVSKTDSLAYPPGTQRARKTGSESTGMKPETQAEAVHARSHGQVDVWRLHATRDIRLQAGCMGALYPSSQRIDAEEIHQRYRAKL